MARVHHLSEAFSFLFLAVFFAACTNPVDDYFTGGIGNEFSTSDPTQFPKPDGQQDNQENQNGDDDDDDDDDKNPPPPPAGDDDDDDDDDDTNPPPSGDDDDDDDDDSPEIIRECHVETFNQPEQAPEAKFDLLFVVDTSGSLDNERDNVRDGIGNFLGQLPDGLIDVRIGVMRAAGFGPSSNREKFEGITGRLFQSGSEPYVINGNMDIEDVKDALGAKFDNLQKGFPRKNSGVDLNGGYGEMGLYSLYRGLTDQTIMNFNKTVDGYDGNDPQKQGSAFFRDGAALFVVFISDENAACETAVTESGQTRPGAKGGGDSENAAQKSCFRAYNSKVLEGERVSPQTVLNHLKALQGANPLLVSAIVHNDENNPPVGNQDEFGYGYMEIADLGKPVGASEGLSIEVAGSKEEIAGEEGPPATGLLKLGIAANEAISLINKFPIDKTGIDESSVEIVVDDADALDPQFWEWVSATKTMDVHPDQVGTHGSEIVINFCTENPASEESE